ncbi:uncharacterized protein LOC124137639 [Haliotis rufescens]|uniref:uncharacterized protein LOC124137639 n=1 Tax=Haliotis rufescens TaxID=6454 RepID=UPI00201F1380|nr:uncharacterized protein LOC124137639 [Haliotis rufescens]
MGTERPADSSSVDMGDSNRRQLSPNERAYVSGQQGNTYMSYDVTNEHSPQPSPQPLAVTDWPMRPYPDQSQEPVWVVPPYREPIIMGYGPMWVSPDGLMTKLYEDDWSGRKPRRGRRRYLRDMELDDDPPRSCVREAVVYIGGFVVLAVALAAIIALVYTRNSQ